MVPFDCAAFFSVSPGSENIAEFLLEWCDVPEPHVERSPTGGLPAWCERLSEGSLPTIPLQFSLVQEVGGPDGPGLRRTAVAPLLSQGEPLGLVCLGRRQDEAFSEREIGTALDFAFLVIIALENQRVLKQQQRMLQETRALLNAAQSILGAEDLPTICQNLDSAFHRLIQADRTSLYLVDHEKRQVIHWAAEGFVDDGLSYEELDAGISGMVFRTGQPVLSLDADDGIEPEPTRQRRKERGVGAIIVVPLIAQGQVIGTVTAVNQINHRKFTQHDVELLMVLVSNAAAAINKVRMLEKLKVMSDRLRVLSFQDALTGLFNRTCFEEELKRMEESGSYPISIILLDVDGLKQVNDRLGHAAGDELLKTMARVIRDVFRSNDIAARVGGDEFGILMERMDQAGVERAVERLRCKMETYNAAQCADRRANPGWAGPEWTLSASIGAATGSGRCSLTGVLKEADARMYREKRSRPPSNSPRTASNEQTADGGAPHRLGP